jgi:adenosylcobinamide-phosphate synthase
MYADLALIAVATEAAAGYPHALYRWIGHPVTWLGALIAWCDRAWNSEGLSFDQRRLRGVGVLLLLLIVSAGVGMAISSISGHFFSRIVALLFCAIIGTAFLAQRSLHEHVAAVATALEGEGVEAGRRAVSMIVGRDTRNLGEAAISRAAIESLAENFSDGVVAPLFWMAVAGLPGAIAYKAVNTADSMIGHKSPRHLAFGWASARFDDLVNLPASRLTALWLILAAALSPGRSASHAFTVALRDAGQHHSPNAGWPEAAMAGALGIRLAGPRVYNGVEVNDHWMGDGRSDLTAGDIRDALKLYRVACGLQIAVLGALVAISVWR